MDEEQKKKRTEDALECINAVNSALSLAKKWMVEYYPPSQSREEDQHIQELMGHLYKAVSTSTNLSRLILRELPVVSKVEPFTLRRYVRGRDG